MKFSQMAAKVASRILHYRAVAVGKAQKSAVSTNDAVKFGTIDRRLK